MAEYVQIPIINGTVTSITAGPGLNGGIITQTGSLSVASVSLTNQVNGILPANNVSSVSLSSNVNGILNYSSINTTGVIRAAGVVGSTTINALSGVVNFDASMTTLKVFNNTVGTGSFIFATLRSNDATAVVGGVISSSGSFILNMAVAPTAETACAFLVVNGP